MTGEPQDDPQIQVRPGKPAEEEEEERKKAGALLPGRAGQAPGLLRGGSGLGGAAEGLAGTAAEVRASTQSAGLLGKILSRLTSPLRSIAGFLRQLAVLGPAAGLKYALRNVVVQGILAGLALALAVGLLVSPKGGSSGDPAGGNPFPSSAVPTADAARGEGLLGSIPGIYDKVMAKIRGDEPPPEVAKADEAAKKDAGEGKEPPPTPDAGPTADPEGRGPGNAAFNLGRLEKMASLSGAGGGSAGGGGGGSVAAFPVAGGKGAGSAGGGAGGGAKGVSTGKLDLMKRNRVPSRGGSSRQGALSARNARSQLDNAKLTSGLGAGASNPQAGASMAALPFDGSPITGPGASNVPGGGIVPLPGSGLPSGGGPGPSNNNGGDPTNTDTGPGDRGPGPDDNPDPPDVGPTTNVTPYQALLNKAASLAGSGQKELDGAKKWKWAAIACFAIAGLIVWGGRGLKRKAKQAQEAMVDTKGVAAARAEFQTAKGFAGNGVYEQWSANAVATDPNLTKIAAESPDSPIASMHAKARALLEAERMSAQAQPSAQGLGAAVQVGSGGFLAAMGAAITIAGLGMTFLGMYRSGMSDGQDKLDQAQEIANEIQDKYGQQEQAQIVRNAANKDCTKDGKPLIKDPDACGFRPDLNTFSGNSNELQAFAKCMAPPTCPRSSTSSSTNGS